MSTSDVDAIKAWIDSQVAARTDAYKELGYESDEIESRAETALRMAVEFIEDADPGEGLMHDCVEKTLAAIRKTLGNKVGSAEQRQANEPPGWHGGREE